MTPTHLWTDPARRIRGFTLVEMLVVMAIISTLAGMLLPSLASARERGRRASCQNNLRNIGQGLLMYATEYGEYMPNNSPANIPGDRYTGVSTARLRPLPGMEMGLGKLVLTNAISKDSVEIFGCPSHVPFLPKTVLLDWRDTGPVESAYLYRETDASPFPDALKRLAVRIKTPYAIVMDNSTVEGMPLGNAHKWEWTNILFSDGHIGGGMNNPYCSRVGTEIVNKFTHDGTPEAMTRVWQQADQYGEK